MHLAHPFYKFPFQFDAARLRTEIDAIPETAWREHHEGFEGNSALTLITTNGTDNDGVDSPMLPTPHLLGSPYMMQVLAKFRTLLGRARLMRLAPHAGVPPHVDIQYYWRQRTRVHIPVVSHPDIKFRCGGHVVHMAEGEAWTFDNWCSHQVINDTDVRRVHLTFDTFGSAQFWILAQPHLAEPKAAPVPFDPKATPPLTFESYVGDPAMSPGEVDYELSKLATDVHAHAANDPEAMEKFLGILAGFRREWRLLWHAKGPVEKALPLFQTLLAQAEKKCLESIPQTLVLSSNGHSALEIVLADFAAMGKFPDAPKKPALHTGARAQIPVPRFDRPVFIVAAPRSGSSLLFESLSANEAFWTLGGEGHEHIENIAALNPENREYDSNRLTAADATAANLAELGPAYAASLRMADGTRLAAMGSARPSSVRFLEKTPKNALRIPFLKAAFPDAKFIFLHREAAPNISAIMEAWQSGRFVTYRNLPGWTGPPWSMLLIPGWRDLVGADPARIATRQWCDTNETILADLSRLPGKDWCAVRYEDVISNPSDTLAALCAFAEVPFTPAMRALTAAPLRWSRHTLSGPHPEKWRKNESAIAPHLDQARATVEKLSAL